MEIVRLNTSSTKYRRYNVSNLNRDCVNQGLPAPNLPVWSLVLSLSHSVGENRSVFLNTRLFPKDFAGFSEGDFHAGTRKILVLVSRGVAILISGNFPQPRRLRWGKADFYGNHSPDVSDRN